MDTGNNIRNGRTIFSEPEWKHPALEGRFFYVEKAELVLIL